MNFKTLLLLSFFSLSVSTSYGFDLFKVEPYTLRHTDGHLILSFQLNKDKKLIIEDGRDIKNPYWYKKNQQYQTDLSRTECGEAKDLRILDAESSKILFHKNFPLPACEEAPAFSFGFMSDTQEFRNRHESIAKVIAYHNSIEPLQFIINGGDIVQDGNKEAEWVDYFAGGKAYLMDIPQIGVLGNHDYRGSKQEGLPKLFKKYLRWQGALDNGNLFFDMPGMQLVVWNSNTLDLPNKEEDLMWKWLEKILAAAQKAHKPVIIATHYPIYDSTVNKFISFTVRKLRKRMVPLVEKYGVRLVLSGHTHMYERSFKDGVNYIVSGPAGGKANFPTYKNRYMQKLDSKALTFTKLSYANKVFRIETFNQNNVLIDQLSLNL